MQWRGIGRLSLSVAELPKRHAISGSQATLLWVMGKHDAKICPGGPTSVLTIIPYWSAFHDLVYPLYLETTSCCCHRLPIKPHNTNTAPKVRRGKSLGWYAKLTEWVHSASRLQQPTESTSSSPPRGFCYMAMFGQQKRAPPAKFGSQLFQSHDKAVPKRQARTLL